MLFCGTRFGTVGGIDGIDAGLGFFANGGSGGSGGINEIDGTGSCGFGGFSFFFFAGRNNSSRSRFGNGTSRRQSGFGGFLLLFFAGTAVAGDGPGTGQVRGGVASFAASFRGTDTSWMLRLGEVLIGSPREAAAATVLAF